MANVCREGQIEFWGCEWAELLACLPAWPLEREIEQELAQQQQGANPIRENQILLLLVLVLGQLEVT